MKRLLLVVDYQKDFVDGARGFPGAEALDGPIAAKIAQYRAAGDDVAFTLDTHRENYLDTQEGRKLKCYRLRQQESDPHFGRYTGYVQS